MKNNAKQPHARPWVAISACSGWLVQDANRKTIACCITEGQDEGRHYANLIAHAPELLEALKDMCEYIESKSPEPERHWVYLQAQLVLAALKNPETTPLVSGLENTPSSTND